MATSPPPETDNQTVSPYVTSSAAPLKAFACSPRYLKSYQSVSTGRSASFNHKDLISSWSKCSVFMSSTSCSLHVGAPGCSMIVTNRTFNPSHILNGIKSLDISIPLVYKSVGGFFFLFSFQTIWERFLSFRNSVGLKKAQKIRLEEAQKRRRRHEV